MSKESESLSTTNDWLTWESTILQDIVNWRSEPADLLFKAITLLGNEIFFVAALPIIWSFFSRKTSTRFTVGLLLTIAVNVWLKGVISWPRPFNLSPGLNIIESAGFGFPSGHSQLTLFFWGALALEAGKRSWLWGAGLLSVAVALSRVYLGVHFMIDVVGGLGFGGLSLWLYYKFAHGIQNAFQDISQAVIGVVLAIIMLLINSSPATLAVAGVLTGMTLPQVFIKEPKTVSSFNQKFLISLASLILCMTLFLSLKSIFPTAGSAHYEAFRFLRFFLMSACIVWATSFLPEIKLKQKALS